MFEMQSAWYWGFMRLDVWIGGCIAGAFLDVGDGFVRKGYNIKVGLCWVQLPVTHQITDSFADEPKKNSTSYLWGFEVIPHEV